MRQRRSSRRPVCSSSVHIETCDRSSIIHIAGGCTGFTQPLDVGINRSFKARCRRMWEEWLVDLLDTTNEVRNATREEVSEWAAAVFWEIVGSRILWNSWRKTGFDWFPGVVD